MSDRKIKITFSEKCTSGFINCFSCLVYKRRTYVTRPKPWHPPSPPPPKKHKHTHTRTNAHAHAHAHAHTHTHTPKIWFIVHASRVEVYAFTLGFKIVYSCRVALLNIIGGTSDKRIWESQNIIVIGFYRHYRGDLWKTTCKSSILRLFYFGSVFCSFYLFFLVFW